MAHRARPRTFPRSFSLDDNTDLDMDTGKTEEQFPEAWIPNAAGTLSVLTLDDRVVPIPVAAGGIYPIPVKRFRSTGTSGVTAVTGLV